MTQEFCSPGCGAYGSHIEGACNVCSHSSDKVFAQAILGTWLGDNITIIGESATEYYLENGGSVLKSAVILL